jgi:hypothetical protein
VLKFKSIDSPLQENVKEAADKENLNHKQKFDLKMTLCYCIRSGLSVLFKCAARSKSSSIGSTIGCNRFHKSLRYSQNNPKARNPPADGSSIFMPAAAVLSSKSQTERVLSG